MSAAKQLIEDENNGKFPKQKSVEWYDTRQNMITASEISSILDCNIHQSAYDLLIKKIIPIEHISNASIEWGNIFEQAALELYESINNIKVYSLGLVTHTKYKWIGASPDGLLLSGKLLEIKCPVTRQIGLDIPLYYLIQMQIQMEVCNIDICDYFECKFYRYKDLNEYTKSNNSTKKTLIYKNSNDEKICIYYKNTGFYLKQVIRDKSWFINNLHTLQYFYDNILHYRKISNGISKLKVDSKNYINLLSTDIQLKYNSKPLMPTISIRSKKRSLENDYNTKGQFINWTTWVSATRIRNYMLDNPIIDWLTVSRNNLPEMENVKNSSDSTNMTFKNHIMKQGISFEKTIIDKIKENFPTETITIANVQEVRSYNKFIKTAQCIKRGVPIIFNGILHDYECRIFGMPDLIVRCDYINKIFNKVVIKNPSKTSYRIIEIKSISLNLISDGNHLQKQANTTAYKGQLYVYNKILGNILCSTPSKSYIIGKGFSYTKDKKQFKGESFDRPAHINFKSNDEFIRIKTANAIRWIRDLTLNSSQMTLYSRPELKSNMCYNDDSWNTIKTRIANNHNDITMLWKCGIKNRTIAESNNVTDWKIHKNLTSKMLGITGEKTSRTVQIFINLNQCLSINNNRLLLHPKKINKKLYDWSNNTLFDEYFIDFETISSNIVNQPSINSAFIFMIGVGTKNINDEWEFKCFISNGITLNDERNMLIEFHSYVENHMHKTSIRKKRLWHWGNAEQYLYKSCMARHNAVLDNHNLLIEWCDLLKLFKSENIITNGMLNFSLKTVVKAFYANNFIKTTYDGLDIVNGLDAMIHAFTLYNNIKNKSIITKPLMINIKKYNEIDCKVVFEILQFLRKHYK
jgi:putative phage-type endonuclease